MVQVNESVGTAQNGSTNALAGSGMASMSLASMLFHPRIEEPSKPNPSVKTSSVNSEIGTLKCCQVPKVSTNFASTILTPVFRAFSITLFALGALVLPVELLMGVYFRITFNGIRIVRSPQTSGHFGAEEI